MNTSAYLNWGRWVVDCPTPGCGNALGYFFPTDDGPAGRDQPEACPASLPAEFHCLGQYGCGRVATIVWPDNFDEVNGTLGIGWHEFIYDQQDDESPLSRFDFKGDTDNPEQSWRPS